MVARGVLWDVSAIDRQRECGRGGILPGGHARVRSTGTGQGRRAGYAGVKVCGAVWSCPVCSAKILARRQDELERGLGEWTAAGNSVVMVTLTMRHRAGQRLAALWDGLARGWDRIVKGRAWRDVRAALGVAGYVRVVETTHGQHGWHVHIHAALFLPGLVGPDAAEALEAAMWSPWRRSLVADGFGEPTREHGIDVKLWRPDAGGAKLGEYFTKASYDAGDGLHRAAMELARGDLKGGRAGNRTPFQVLAGLVDHGDADDLDLWREWEVASQGRRQMTWSRGMRSTLGLDAERTDEELAAEEVGTADDDLVDLPPQTYAYLARNELLGLVLDLAEVDDDGAALRRWLDGRGLAYTDVRPGRVGT